MILRYLPNLITCLRILLIMPIMMAILANHYTRACYLFIIAGISDGLDGFIARRFNWISRFGSIMDPLADKLLLMACFITLAWQGLIPIGVPIIIIIRDLWVISGAISYHYLISHYEMAPTYLSKVNTFLQILLLLLTLLNLGVVAIHPMILRMMLWLMLGTCILSGLHYTYVWGTRALKAYKVKTQ